MQDAQSPLDMAVLGELRAVLGEEFPLLVSTFVSDGQLRIRLMRSALASADAEGLRESAHAFKGSSVNVGATALSNLCRDIESSARVGDFASAAARMVDVEAAFTAAAAALAAS